MALIIFSRGVLIQILAMWLTTEHVKTERFPEIISWEGMSLSIPNKSFEFRIILVSVI